MFVIGVANRSKNNSGIDEILSVKSVVLKRVIPRE